MQKIYYAFTLLCALILLTGTFHHSQNFEEEIYKWKIVSVYDRSMPIYQHGMEKFVSDFNVISQGKLKIEFYAAGEYKNIKPFDVFDAVSEGTVEMGFGTSLYWAAEKIPGSNFMYAVPFGLSAKDMHAWLYRGGGLELWREMYEPFNVIPFPVGDTGGAMGGWFRNEINSILDFKGMKIRTFGNDAKVLEKLGANPVWMPMANALDACIKREIEAIVGLGPYADYRYKLHRELKYYYYPGWQEPCGVLSLIINRNAWDNLPRYLQKTIENVCGNTYQYISTQFESMNSNTLRELNQKEIVNIIKFPPEVLYVFRRISNEILEENAKKNQQFNKIYQSFKKFKEFNVDSGWGKIVDEAVYPERMSKLINELNNSTIATAMEKGNNGVVISLSGDASFASSSSNPNLALSNEISRIVKIINDYLNSIAIIKVEGHTSSEGPSYLNWLLSKDRAYAVVKLLTDNGVKRYLIKPVFYGDTMPIADNNTPEGRRKNRRVEIIIEF